MKSNRLYKILTYSIATVWIINGFFCKVLNLVPRHEQIVQAITNVDRPSAYFLTFIIGICEIVMAIWILSGYRTKLNAIIQIAVVATMNTLEFILVPDLLLWGELNSLFAFGFILVVYYNEFHLNKKQFK
jgi:uncharacterized membrane protein YphA (DoxX/SURF4 family)